MKYFTLSFTVEKCDYDAYYRDFGKGLLFDQLRRSAVTLIFLAVIAVINFTAQAPSLYVTFAAVLFIMLFTPISYSRKIALSLIQSRNSRKVNRYEFYADHIEIHVDEDEGSRARVEKHLKMSGFTSVAESKSNFYFSYMNEKMLIIPKRVLDNEKYGMIKNLIDNYFSNVYMSV